MTYTAHIHACGSALQRDLAHLVARMVPQLHSEDLEQLAQGLEQTLRPEHAITVHRQENALELYRNEDHILSITATCEPC